MEAVFSCRIKLSPFSTADGPSQTPGPLESRGLLPLRNVLVHHGPGFLHGLLTRE